MIDNHVQSMWDNRSHTLTAFGKDQTGKISYTFNQQGFRGNQSYNYSPDYAFFGCSLVFGIGVPYEQTFAAQFKNAQNFGLAGSYNNSDIFVVLKKFVESDLYNTATKIVVVWHSRNQENVPEYVQQLNSYPIHHFFTGDKVNKHRCYNFFKELDLDASGTHMGPKSHKFFYNILCATLKQS